MTVEEFDRQLAELRRKIEAAGYRIRTVWVDEYGGAQSVSLSSSDILQVESP